MSQHSQRSYIRHSLSAMLVACLLNVASVTRLTAEEQVASLHILSKAEQDHGNYAQQRIHTWYKLINDYKDATTLEKLELVNNFFNQLAFVNDSDLWGQEDYWATPIQMLSSNGGDCEDFSIAKYFTLRKMGIPEDRLRLTYVKALQLNQAHMILTYFPTPDADPLILDNLVTAIRPSSERTDLLPVYSFNGNGLWLSRKKGTDERVGQSERLSQWQGVIARINSEEILQSP